MSRLKKPIQTAHFLLRARRVDIYGSFKQKTIFCLEGGIVASPHSLARQAFEQNGSIICERPFAKKSGISLCGKLCAMRRYQE
jgi:hypothetical protein